MTHEQVRQLVRRVNPIPDPSVLESVDAPVLELERSKDMQVDERPMAEERWENRWRGPLIGIAAAAVIVVGTLIYFNTDQAPVAEPAPDAIPLPGDFESVEPGAYFIDTDGDGATSTRGTFVLGGGWSGIQVGVNSESGDVSLFVVEPDLVWEGSCEDGAPAPAGTTAKALADQFAAIPGFTTIEELAPATAFGHQGYHMVVEVPLDCTGPGVTIWGDPVWEERYYSASGQVEEYWFLDVEGATVMVEATRFPGSSEEVLAELQAVIDTLVITP